MSKKKQTLPGVSFAQPLAKQMRDPRFRNAFNARRAMHEISRAVASIRESLSLSQAELAERLHTAQSVISRLESGKDNRVPRLDTLAGIAGALDMRLRLVFEPVIKNRSANDELLEVEFPARLLADRRAE
jgi:transcriptional regulator with XRE-family HTH domain